MRKAIVACINLLYGFTALYKRTRLGYSIVQLRFCNRQRSLAKMNLTNFLVILMVVILAVCAQAAPRRRPPPPPFTGYGTFNPRGNLPVPFPRF
ncbi:hypothetical protein KPH14_008639 [Odynerus spinipes]|uniref:Uncharacterized protein n=1 Tax=Odynerus spinipes TaxID=1348599 RepID=A0AAD9RSH7_9HYME|nr:hypothetical protein KPH14_008639 [Odynerus spinipes]